MKPLPGLHRGGGDEFAACGILIAQYISCELYDHHLHAEADTEGRYVVSASIFSRNNLAFDASLAKAWADDDTTHPF